MCKPFVKWAGGKSQLLNEIRLKYPHNIEKYCEPFVGGGAVLFDVLEKYNIKEVLINDINSELMNTYIQIRNNLSLLIQKLKRFQDEYNDISEEERLTLYLRNRDEYNSLIYDYKEKDLVRKAALFIFLNKTCFNGLYRVNKEGKFNVPKGKYRNPLICDKDNLEAISKLLFNVTISIGDFELCDSFIDNNTFVYIDPPYRPLSNTASFTSYDKSDFDDTEQKRLSKFINKITNRGAKIVLSNSDPKNINDEDDFFDELYSNYNIIRIDAKRMINSKGSNRGSIKELLIAN